MNRFRVVKALLMNAPVSLTMAVVTQIWNLLLGHSQSFSLGGMALNFCFSYAVACCISCFLPTEKPGLALAKKLHAKPGTWPFAIWVNLVVNTIFCVLMTLIMTWFNVCLLGGAPLSAIPSGFAEMIVPVWIACFAVSLFTQRPAIRMAEKLSEKETRQTGRG